MAEKIKYPITLQIKVLHKNTTPSLTHEEDYNQKDIQEVLDLETAIVRLDQRDAKVSSHTPRFEFEIEFDREDDKNAPILEWVNCFWSDSEHNKRILREVTLITKDTLKSTSPDRYYTINKAFIAYYEEEVVKEAKTTNIKIIIRANDEDQKIELTQIPDQEEEDDDNAE